MVVSFGMFIKKKNEMYSGDGSDLSIFFYGVVLCPQNL